jgi:endonuclease YncB( thermonuclease family)
LGADERGSDRPQIPSRPNATAIDGDSLRLGDREIRLVGIDAPELFQTCRNEHGGEWACGREARSQLSEFLYRDMVNCVSKAKDRYGRTLATCSAGPVADIGEAMVRAGYAVNFMSGGYQAAEAAARSEKRGIWRGAFEQPQEWRRRKARSD